MVQACVVYIKLKKWRELRSSQRRRAFDVSQFLCRRHYVLAVCLVSIVDLLAATLDDWHL